MQNLVWSCIESGKRKTASLRLEEVEYSYLFYYSFSVKNGKKYNYSEHKYNYSIIIVNI